MNYKEVYAVSGEPLKAKGVTNILLIGNDSRTAGEDGRSDAMILLSISDKTKTIHMTSLLRDMYVDIPGHDGNRLNAAYSFGGAELLMETVEANLDVEVNRFVQVNFQAFADVVDAVGGVDLEVTNEEVLLINGYLEASYPSSTTLMVLCVMPTAMMQVHKRIKHLTLRWWLNGFLVAFTMFMVSGRLVSGVHWLSDIIGGAMLSGGLVMLYVFVCLKGD